MDIQTHSQLFFNNRQSLYHKSLYVQTKTLTEQNDPEIDVSKKDISFGIHVMLQILMAIKHEPGLFSDTVSFSEWDYIVKFWGPITHLTLHDASGNRMLKVDIRIIHASIKQRCNVENEVGVAEVSEENLRGVLIESKAIIGRFILNGCRINNADSLQICGMVVYFIKLELRDNGLYTETQHYHSVSAKRPAPQLIDDEISTKQTWIRGSWNPPRTTKTPPPPEPSNLYFKQQ
ncbi:MAG: hypothetical protein EXX96DRAFT_595278 [Benjaminiella poitrasii]|nr:MAG: hypothetical protein EXX96DRAFT_595278 [Benjaminiella poitrasii]